jgi:hypothetical protein
MTSDFDTKLKETSLPVIWLKHWLKNPGRSVRNEHNKLILILVDPVDDEDWRDRPRTDPPVSDLGWLRSYPGPQTSGFQLDFPAPYRFSARSIDRDSLVMSGFWYPLSYRVSYRVSYLDLFLLNMNLNKGRD